MNQRERALYQFPLNGRHFIDDNNTVYRLLCDLLIRTPSYVWVEQYDRSQNGRDAWMALVEHYEGGGQRKKRKSSALATLRFLHYKNESVFSFEDFSRKVVRAYRDLEGTEEAYTPYNKVQTLLTKIEISLPRVEVTKAHVRANHRLDIDAAIAYLSTEFAEIFADAMSFRRGRSQINGTSDDRDDGRHVRQRVRRAAQMALSISSASTLPTFVATSPTKKCRISDHGDRHTSSRNAGTWVFAEAAPDPDVLQDRDAAKGVDDSTDDTTADYKPVFQPCNNSGMMLVLSLTRFSYHPHQQFNHSLQQHLQQQLP